MIIQNSELGGRKFKFNFYYTEVVSKALAAGRKAAKGSVYFDDDLNMSTRISPVLREQVWKAVANALYKGVEDKKIAHLIYIPAGRSFFANLQKIFFLYIYQYTD